MGNAGGRGERDVHPADRTVVGPVVDLREPGASVELSLVALDEHRATVETRCRLAREEGGLVVRVEADDPDMTELVATAPRPGVVDQFLYEEDILQVSLADAGQAEVDRLLLINPMGNQRAIGPAAAWTSACARHAAGWSIELRMPLTPGAEAVGLSLHRYFRGLHHEAMGLSPAMPHPLKIESFAVVVLAGADAQATAEACRAGWRETAGAALRERLDALRARINEGAAKGPAPDLQLCRELALTRAEDPVTEGESFLCWNEGHFQHGLLDLWELDEDRRWIDLAIERMAGTLACRADRRGAACELWDEPLPTWYHRHATTLSTGVILGPIARLLRTVRHTPGLSDLWDRVAPWVELAHQSIDVHDREWVELPGGSGMYIEPYLKGPARIYARGGSRMCPVNRAFFLGMAQLDLWHVSGRPCDLDKARRMARYFRDASETLENQTWVWEYLVSRYPATGEDHSHAQAQVRFAMMLADSGIEFDGSDLEALGRTLERNLFRYEQAPCTDLRGYGPGLWWDMGLWAVVAGQFAPHLIPQMEQLMQAALGEARFDFAHQGWGVRNLACLEMGRRLAARG